MHIGSQRQLKQQLSDMHGRNPVQAIGPRITFSKVSSLSLGDHACPGAKLPQWPTETTFAVPVGHLNDVVQAFTLEKMHQGKGVHDVGV